MTQVLLKYIVRFSLILIALATVVVAAALGAEEAIGVLVGGGLAFADGLGLVYLVGQLLEPGAKLSKPALFALLFMKLVGTVALIWVALSVWRVSGLGVVIGIGTALAGLVLGANRGSSSPEGQRAMAEAEAGIREELGDTDADSS